MWTMKQAIDRNKNNRNPFKLRTQKHTDYFAFLPLVKNNEATLKIEALRVYVMILFRYSYQSKMIQSENWLQIDIGLETADRVRASKYFTRQEPVSVSRYSYILYMA